MAFSQNFDTDWLIAQAKRFESLATSSQTFDDTDLIEFFNSELQSKVTQIIQSVNEEYGVMSIDYDLSQLGSTNALRIPSQATGARLRNLQYVSPQGYITNIPRLMPDKLGMAGFWGSGFYLKNNEIVFYPGPPSPSAGTLRMTYFRRSNTLTSVLNTGRVIAIDLIGNTVTLDNSPIGAEWQTGALLDIIVGTSPFDFRERDAVLIDIAGAVLELDPATIAEIELGDYFALSGFTPVAQFIPAEAMQLLAQLGAARCLQSLGDTEGYKISINKANEMEAALKNLISDRVEGQPKRLVARGMTRRASWNGWYW